MKMDFFTPLKLFCTNVLLNCSLESDNQSSERGTFAGEVMANALIKMLGQKILPVLQMLSVRELLLCVAFEGGFLLPCAGACEVQSDGGSTPKL